MNVCTPVTNRSLADQSWKLLSTACLVDTSEVEACLATVKVVVNTTLFGCSKHVLVSFFGWVLGIEVHSGITHMPLPLKALEFKGPSISITRPVVDDMIGEDHVFQGPLWHEWPLGHGNIRQKQS